MYKLSSKVVVNSIIGKRFINKKLVDRYFSTSDNEKFKNLENIKDKDKSVRLPGAQDQKNLWKVLNYEYELDVHDMIPRQTDVIIVGGGIIGWSAAYFLKLNTTLSVTIIERDPSHTRSASVLGIGAIRQQFSEPENIQMSLYGAEFLRNIREHLSILDLDPPDIQFHPHGFLTLASESGYQQLKKCFEVQKTLGAKVELLSKEDVKSVWPWMAVEDIGGAIHGYENEGWFDQWQLLNALQRKACSLGAQPIVGEVVGFDFQVLSSMFRADLYKNTDQTRNPISALVRLLDGTLQPISFSQCLNAAGPWAADVGVLLGMGSTDPSGGLLNIPVEPRVQHSFVVSSRSSGSHSSPGIDCPFIVDYDGLNVRRDRLGGDFIVFLDTPPLSKHFKRPPSVDDRVVGNSGLAVNFDHFESHIRSQLARRIPSLANAVVRSGWAAPLDYNYIDQNLIVGRHPSMANIILANGSSGHGIEHSFAIGRAVYELMVFSEFKTIDLRQLSFTRFYEHSPIFEKEVF